MLQEGACDDDLTILNIMWNESHSGGRKFSYIYKC